jgi:hypothetical protein
LIRSGVRRFGSASVVRSATPSVDSDIGSLSSIALVDCQALRTGVY